MKETKLFKTIRKPEDLPTMVMCVVTKGLDNGPIKTGDSIRKSLSGEICILHGDWIIESEFRNLLKSKPLEVRLDIDAYQETHQDVLYKLADLRNQLAHFDLTIEDLEEM